MSGIYSLTIPSAFVNSYSGVSENREIVFDRGAAREVSHKVLTASFGDGYEQRIKEGLNPKTESINIAFANRAAHEVDLLAAYLDSMVGKKISLIFSYYTAQNTVAQETVLAVSDSYNITYLYDTARTLTTTFRRVYEPA